MTATATRPAAFRPFSAVAAAWRWFDRERRLRATVYTLHDLPDRTLRDIGLDRGDINARVRERGLGR